MKRPNYSEVLERTEVLPKLSAFNPHVVGTPPLGLDLPTSDVDVICFAPDANAFACAVWKAFGTRPEFRIWQKVGLGRPVVAHITDAGWTIEIFGQAVPISQQSGWRHFLVEQRLLAFGGEAFRIAVMAQRTTGMKTEPAFAAVLGLDGDPFEGMLRLQRCSDIELIAMLRHRGFG